MDRRCLALGDLVRECGGGRREAMLVVIVGIASGEVARRGVAGRSGRRNLAGRSSRASSLPSNGGEGGSCMFSGSICKFCMIVEE